MANTYFQFKQFIIHQDKCAMKVTTDACLFGSIVSKKIINKGPLKILEIGTGTGLLPLMLAQKNKHTKIDAIEIDQDACKQAKENINLSPWQNNIQVIHSDVRNFNFSHSYDMIISNPPFYENELKGGDKKRNIAQHCDQLSLCELLTVIKKNIADDGRFYLLVPYKRIHEIKLLLKENQLQVLQLILVKQSINHNYFRFIVEGCRELNLNNKIKNKEIAIRDEHDKYTSEFETLLKDYYLKF